MLSLVWAKTPDEVLFKNDSTGICCLLLYIPAQWAIKAKKIALFSCQFRSCMIFFSFSVILSLTVCPTLSLCFWQTPEELEDDSDFEQEDYDTRSRTSVQTEDDQLIAGQSARVSRCTLPHCTETSQMCLSYGIWHKKERKKKVFLVYEKDKPKCII